MASKQYDYVKYLREFLGALDRIEAGGDALGEDLGARGQVFQSSGNIRTSLGRIDAKGATAAIAGVDTPDMAKALLAAAVGQAVYASKLTLIIGTALRILDWPEDVLKAVIDNAVCATTRGQDYALTYDVVKAYVEAAKQLSQANSALYDASLTAKPKGKRSGKTLEFKA